MGRDKVNLFFFSCINTVGFKFIKMSGMFNELRNALM